MTEDEKLVRETWEEIFVEDHTECCGPDTPFIIRTGNRSTGWRSSIAQAWKEAADFTRQRLQEITELDEEIMEAQIGLHGYEGMKFAKPSCESLSRTIKRLEAMRDEKKRGMRA